MKDKKDKYSIEQYFEVLFRHKKVDEFITLFFVNKDDESNKFQLHFKTINEAIDTVNKYKQYNNCFVSLGLTDGKGRTKENISSRSVMAFDFDKKDLGKDFNHVDVMNLFKKAGIYYHMMISSGYGYHVYVLVENETNIDGINKLLNINEIIAHKVNSDNEALKPSQILRVPGTYNFKYDNQVKVNTMFIACDENQKEYNLDKLEKKHCFKIEDNNIKYINKDNMSPCIKNMLDGVPIGHRNFTLGRLTKHFQRNNNSKAQVWNIIKEWNTKCKPQNDIELLEKTFEDYWNKPYKLLGCVCENDKLQQILNIYCDKHNCKKNDKYEIIHLIQPIEYEYKLMEKIKPRGGLMLDGNHIAIIGILKNYKSGLNTNQLKEELTSTITKKCCMSKPTMIKVLKELQDMKIISCIESKNKTIPNLYKINDIKTLENEKVAISYHATQRYIDGAIGQSAFRIYCYMMYRLSKGINIVMERLSEELGITQQAISKSIQQLEQGRFLVIETDYSINSLGANKYRWLV